MGIFPLLNMIDQIEFCRMESEQPFGCEISNHTEEVISVSDIYPFYQMEQGELDDYTYQQAEETKKKKISVVVNRLNRCIEDIRPYCSNSTKLEIYLAFDKCCHDPNELVLNIENKDFMQAITREAKELTIKAKIASESISPPKPAIAARSNNKKSNKSIKTKNLLDDEISDDSAYLNLDSDDDNDDPYDFAYHSSRKKPNAKPRAKPKRKSVPEPKKPEKKPENSKPRRQQNVELPKPDEIDEEVWENWSFAHKQSYLKGIKNANAYYYRNLPPGEKCKFGKWTPEEIRIFMNRIKSMSKNSHFYELAPQWGIFSMAIPGRVGYQCANFYRNLVLEGKIIDPRYQVDDGKLKYIAFGTSDGRKRSRKSQKMVLINDNDNEQSFDVNEDDDNTSTDCTSIYEKYRDNPDNPSLYQRLSKENPLQGAKDSVTGNHIRIPAISPDGYLLDYSTWLKIIKQGGCDPYTRKHITKRSITILNFDNIEKYRSQIRNLDMEEV